MTDSAAASAGWIFITVLTAGIMAWVIVRAWYEHLHKNGWKKQIRYEARGHDAAANVRGRR